MTPEERACNACACPLPPGAVFHRVRLVIQGEQELDPDAPLAESPGDLLARMENEGDWDRYTEDVHWERGAELCTPCRDRLRALVEPLLGYRE